MAAQALTTRRSLFGGALALTSAATACALPAATFAPPAKPSGALKSAARAWILRWEEDGGTFHVGADGMLWRGAAPNALANLAQADRECVGALREEVKRQVLADFKVGLRTGRY